MKPPIPTDKITAPPTYRIGRVDWSPDFMSNKPRSSEFIAMRVASERLGVWLSAALEDPGVCEEMKRDIRSWFDALKKL